MREKFDYNIDNKAITSISSEVKTVEDALRKGKINPDIFRVKRSIVNHWEVGVKIDNEIIITPLWQVKVWLEEIHPKHITDALPNLFKRLAILKPAKPKTPKKSITQNSHSLEISLFDSHFGKLCWESETGSAYDTKRAAKIYSNAIDDLLDLTGNFKITEIIYPIGNDFFNVNNWEDKTARGTEQHCDSRFQKVFDVGCESIIQSINKCLHIAPVKILWVPGNHDPETSWYLCKCLEYNFKDNKNVSVDVTPTYRKYYQYGKTLIGYTHGNEEKHIDLPGIMMSECGHACADAVYKCWHLGHFHRRKQMSFLSADTFQGFQMQIISSLSGTDSWHYHKGYIGNSPAAESFLYSASKGLVANFMILKR